MTTEGFIGQLAVQVTPENMDALDKKIVYLLSLNCRLSNTALAHHLKTSREVVAYRIQRLQDLDVLHGFLTLINAQALGRKLHTVGLKVHTAIRIEELASALLKHPSTSSLSHCGGMFDLLVTIQANSDEDCYATFHDILGTHQEKIKSYQLFSKLEQHFSPLSMLVEDKKELPWLSLIQEQKGSAFLPAFQKRKKQGSPLFIIDEDDKRILKELNHNARAPLSELSSRSGVSLFQLQKRINNLIQGNIIQAFVPYVSLAKCGLHYYFVFVNVRQRAEPAFRTWVELHPSIVWRTKLLGSYNYKLSFFVENNHHLADVLKEMYQEFGEAILQTESLPVFNSSKYVSFLG